MRKKISLFLKRFGLHIVKEPRTFFDVVCGMELKLGKIKHATEYAGETYYFCAKTCMDHFVNDPKKYVG